MSVLKDIYTQAEDRAAEAIAAWVRELEYDTLADLIERGDWRNASTRAVNGQQFLGGELVVGQGMLAEWYVYRFVKADGYGDDGGFWNPCAGPYFEESEAQHKRAHMSADSDVHRDSPPVTVVRPLGAGDTTPPVPTREQDTTTCTICGNALEHEPQLGDWIAHPRCMESVLVRVEEAEQRAQRVIARELADAHAQIEALQAALDARITMGREWQRDADRYRVQGDSLLNSIHEGHTIDQALAAANIAVDQWKAANNA